MSAYYSVSFLYGKTIFPVYSVQITTLNKNKQSSICSRSENDQSLIFILSYYLSYLNVQNQSLNTSPSQYNKICSEYDIITNKLVDMLNNLDEKYKFSKILLLDNYNLCQEVDDKNCVVGSMQQVKLPKIIELGKFIKQEQKKK
ncbi:Hypothetical_protein [Hexamita inflata]|uniref:Hypothetical_protein n=1 Tax=Hexamita inflata TaxID=28002 RepID=A0ABP1HKS8_9EUKA